MALPRFLVAEMDADHAVLEGEQAAHLATVLRARLGDEVEIAHAGRVFLARVAGVERERVRLDVIAPLAAPPPAPPLILATALFKFDRFEWMLEKAGELGATIVYPLITRRTDTRNADPRAPRLERWRRILRSAAEQSHRADLPELVAPQPLARFLEQPRSSGAERWIFSERGGEPAAGLAGRGHKAAVLLTGPEGGWEQAELAAAAQAGFVSLSLGPLILRCETAVLAAMVLARMGAIRGGPAPPPD